MDKDDFVDEVFTAYRDGVFTIKVGGVTRRFRVSDTFVITAVQPRCSGTGFFFFIYTNTATGPTSYRFESNDQHALNDVRTFIESCLIEQ